MQNVLNINEPKNMSIKMKYSLDFDDLENIKCENHRRITTLSYKFYVSISQQYSTLCVRYTN